MMSVFEGLLTSLVNAVVVFQQATGFPEWVNNTSAAWPIAEVLHFIGLCLLIGAVGMMDLRLLGLARGVPVSALQRLIPYGVGGFILCLVTGVLFVLGNAFAPGEYLTNIAFLWKMIFIALAGLNLAYFYASGIARRVEALAADAPSPTGAKVVGGLSLLLWVGVILFGRFLPILGDAF